MSLASTPIGDTLLAYYPGRELTIPPDYHHLPLIFACVVAHYQGKTVYVFNLWRKEWELPAGQIEPGETPEAAAIRELREESGQVALSMEYAGIAVLRLAPDLRFEMGVMFRCDLPELRPFTANAETDRLLLWDTKTVTAEYVDEISLKLAELVDAGG